jgi:lipoate---protein ligase
MKRRVLDLTLPSIAENLALDEALLLEADGGNESETLRFWEWPTAAAILGASGKLHDDVDEEACRQDGVKIQRRASGGGTVLLGRGCLLYTFVLSMEANPALRDIHASYRYLLNWMAEALKSVGAIRQEGISDLAIAGMKISGSSQQRKRNFMLHHGTLLYDFDVSAMSRYLRMPDKQPAYRAQRSHDAFVENLRVDPGELKRLLRIAWGGEETAARPPADLVTNLIAEKYGKEDWVRRR